MVGLNLLLGIGLRANAQQTTPSRLALAGEQATQSQKPETKEAASKTEEKKSEFTRIRRDEEGNPIAFETSIVRYVGKNKKGEDISVDLVGAIHIGEKAYYERLNKQFEGYEALLYELVAPEGTKIEKGAQRKSGFSAVSSLQRTMKDFLGLDFQLDHIDYTKKNFIHADMSPDEFSKSMKANEESGMRIFFKMLGHSVGAQGKPGAMSDADIISLLFAKDRDVKLRRLMAEQLQSGDDMLSVFEGKDGSTIITHRNKKALSVLQREIDNGKQNLGIFYGAGHFPDMEQRLIEEFKLKKTDEKWISAWQLTDEPVKGDR